MGGRKFPKLINAINPRPVVLVVNRDRTNSLGHYLTLDEVAEASGKDRGVRTPNK